MPGGRARAVAITGAAIVGIGCGTLDGFECIGDAQCRRDGQAGACVEVGFCAYPDDMCPSGMRFSPDAATAIAGECTEPMLPGSSGSGAEAGSGSTGMPMPADTSDSGPSDESTSTGGPVPICGDGMTQEGEECDDANDQRGDGCNPDCRISGILVSSFASELEGSDVAWDLLLLDDDIVIVGHATVLDEDVDLLAGRFDDAGTPKWIRTWSGDAHLGDRIYALAVSPSGALLAGGYVIPMAPAGTTPRPQLWLGELDPGTGDLVWEASEGDPPPSNDQIWDIVIPEDDSVVVTGRIGPASTADFVVRRYAVANNGVLSPDWTRLVQGAADRADWGFALALDASGRLVAGGATRATTADIDHHLEVFLLDGASPRPPCVDDGSEADTRVPEGNDQIRGLAIAPDGRIAATGFATKSAADGIDAWLGLYDPDACDLLWQRTVSGAAGDRDEGRSVAVDEDGTIVTVGYLRDANTDDLWVAKWDDAGAILWQAELFNGPGDGTDLATSVAIDEDGEIVVAGYVSKPGGSDAWVGRFTP